MPDTNPTSPAPAAPGAPAAERRTNRRLRELIDEMLASVRVAVNRDLWTPEERAAAEAELAHLMDAVRRETLARAPTRVPNA